MNSGRESHGPNDIAIRNLYDFLKAGAHWEMGGREAGNRVPRSEDEYALG